MRPYSIDRGSSALSGSVWYHKTCIVQWNRDYVRLHNGGWQSVTTRRKMNQVSEKFNLGISVWQRRNEWYCSDVNGNEFEFYNGIRLKRNHEQTD